MRFLFDCYYIYMPSVLVCQMQYREVIKRGVLCALWLSLFGNPGWTQDTPETALGRRLMHLTFGPLFGLSRYGIVPAFMWVCAHLTTGRSGHPLTKPSSNIFFQPTIPLVKYQRPLRPQLLCARKVLSPPIRRCTTAPKLTLRLMGRPQMECLNGPVEGGLRRNP